MFVARSAGMAVLLRIDTQRNGACSITAAKASCIDGSICMHRPQSASLMDWCICSGISVTLLICVIKHYGDNLRRELCKILPVYVMLQKDDWQTSLCAACIDCASLKTKTVHRLTEMPCVQRARSGESRIVVRIKIQMSALQVKCCSLCLMTCKSKYCPRCSLEIVCKFLFRARHAESLCESRGLTPGLVPWKTILLAWLVHWTTLLSIAARAYAILSWTGIFLRIMPSTCQAGLLWHTHTSFTSCSPRSMTCALLVALLAHTSRRSTFIWTWWKSSTTLSWHNKLQCRPAPDQTDQVCFPGETACWFI